MPAFSRPSTRVQIGAWAVDPSTGQLTRGTEMRRARPLVTDLLLYLATRPGEVVTKDELIAGPWGGAIVADSALTSTIAELRELLDDESKKPRYIETRPKRGYRLIADVSVLDATPARHERTQSEATPALAEAMPASPAPPVPAQSVAALVPPSADAVIAPAAALAPAAPVGELSVVAAPLGVAPAIGIRHSWWSRHSWTLAFALGAAFTIGVTVWIAWRPRLTNPAPPVRAMRLTVDLPNGVRLAPDSVPRIALTADGTRMAYVVRTDAGTALYTRTLDQFEAHPVSGTEAGVAPFFSPDGSRIGYVANGELKTVPVGGGEPAIVCQARIPLGASWGPDDTIVFSGTHGLGLFEVPAAGGQPRELTTPDRSRRELSHRWPQVLPDGNHILYTAIGHGRADALVVSRQSGERHVVVENANGSMYVAPDRIMFERNGRLLLAPIDPDRFVLTGPERVVVKDMAITGPGFGDPAFAVASGGALVYVPVDPHDTERELVWVDRSGHAAPVGAPLKSYMHPRLSSDGRQILTWLRTEDPDLWLYDIASRAMTRLATGVAARRPAFSPDGLHVIFDGPSPDNPVTMFEVDVRGGPARRLRPEKNSQYAGTWTPDSHTIAFLDLRTKTGFDIVTMAAEPNGPATPVLRGPANETAPAFSPDGRLLAFVSDATGREEVYVVSYPQTGTPLQVSNEGGREPVWSANGDELYFRLGRGMYTVRVTHADQPRVSESVQLFTGDFDQRPAFHPSYDVAADGRFLMIRGTAAATTDTRIAVLLRWDAQ